MKVHFLIFFMFFMSLFSFVMNRKHMLMMLLILEFIVVSLLFLMFMYFSNLSNDHIFSMLLLSFSVCESILGLSLLVSLIRSHGSDYFNLLNLSCLNFYLVYSS